MDQNYGLVEVAVVDCDLHGFQMNMRIVSFLGISIHDLRSIVTGKEGHPTSYKCLNLTWWICWVFRSAPLPRIDCLEDHPNWKGISCAFRRFALATTSFFGLDYPMSSIQRQDGEYIPFRILIEFPQLCLSFSNWISRTFLSVQQSREQLHDKTRKWKRHADRLRVYSSLADFWRNSNPELVWKQNKWMYVFILYNFPFAAYIHMFCNMFLIIPFETHKLYLLCLLASGNSWFVFVDVCKL